MSVSIGTTKIVPIDNFFNLKLLKGGTKTFVSFTVILCTP